MKITEEEMKQFREGNKKKLHIYGSTEDYETYLVPISYLFYNDMNGRISSFIEEYNAEHPNAEESLENLRSDVDKYNDIIAQYIISSSNDNGVSYKKTKEDIREKGQQIAGVILDDGRIIDGNRRFTCLRALYKETGDSKFGYFEAVILPTPETDRAWEEIKLLELNLQFNVDVQKDYERIDFLVSFFKDTMDSSSTRLIDKARYCKAAGIKQSEYENNKRIVEVMLDYLDWRGMPKAFYILKREKLDGPLEELPKTIRKVDSEYWEDIKETVYTFMTLNTSGDRTRDMRELLKLVRNKDTAVYKIKDELEKPDTTEAIETILDQMNGLEQVTGDVAENTAGLKETIVQSVLQTINDAAFDNSIKKNNDAPKTIIKKACDQLKECNLGSIDFEEYTQEDKTSLAENIATLEAYLEEIKNGIK